MYFYEAYSINIFFFFFFSLLHTFVTKSIKSFGCGKTAPLRHRRIGNTLGVRSLSLIDFTVYHQTQTVSTPEPPNTVYLHFGFLSFFVTFSLPYVSLLESVREDLRKKLSTVWTNEMSEFWEFRKSSCYWFKKRNMEDSEDLWYFRSRKYNETKKKNEIWKILRKTFISFWLCKNILLLLSTTNKIFLKTPVPTCLWLKSVEFLVFLFHRSYKIFYILSGKYLENKNSSSF